MRQEIRKRCVTCDRQVVVSPLMEVCPECGNLLADIGR